MRRLAIAMLLVGLAVAACARKAPLPPPVQGPAVLSDASVEILDWEYLGPDAVESLPLPSADVREVGYDILLIEKDDGFELLWLQLPCAIRPVLVVHAGMSMEFWPGESVISPCEARGSFHEITVKLQTSVPFEQWKFTLYPPPEPTPERWR